MEKKKTITRLVVWYLALFFSLATPALYGDVPTNPIAQMEIAFEGNYSKLQIRKRLNKAMELYNLPKTEENYSRAGSALVTLRKEFGPSEMEILSYMIRSHVPGIKMDFPSAAGIAAAFLSAGDL
ncbi:MAG: hypothetical protein ABH844_01475 [Candidatus Omnitrophota bacterium]